MPHFRSIATGVIPVLLSPDYTGEVIRPYNRETISDSLANQPLPEILLSTTEKLLRVEIILNTVHGILPVGGFSQFFFNSSGNFSNELVDAFTKISAFKTAEICKKALAVFKGNVPTDRDEREELLDSLDCDDALSECDDEFYEYEDNLEELNYTYIMDHRSFFY